MNQSCFYFSFIAEFSKGEKKKFPQIYLRRDGGNVFSCQLLYNGVEKESEARLNFLLFFFLLPLFFYFFGRPL